MQYYIGLFNRLKNVQRKVTALATWKGEDESFELFRKSVS